MGGEGGEDRVLETEEFPGQVAGRQTGLAFGEGKMQVERKVPHAPRQRLEGVLAFGLPHSLSHILRWVHTSGSGTSGRNPPVGRGRSWREQGDFSDNVSSHHLGGGLDRVGW